MKLYQEPVQVTIMAGLPARITRRRQLYRVTAIHEHWVYNGKWWTTPKLQGRFRQYFHVTAIMMTANSYIAPEVEMEIYEESGRWTLCRVAD